MSGLFRTVSFCPTCYKRVPAQIEIGDDGVYLQKSCSEHGATRAMVERSVDYYLQCRQANAQNIYNGYFLDVTSRCNLNCAFCYYKRANRSDPSIEFIRDEIAMNAYLGPIILHGGEPSLRSDLSDILKIAPKIELLTNGTGIVDRLDEVLPLLTEPNGVVRINLSIHKESRGVDSKLLVELAKRGLKAESILWVIDSVYDIPKVFEFVSDNSVAIEAVRIKAATKLWAEQKPENKIFVSDMWNMAQNYNVEPVWWRNNKTSFFNFKYRGIYYMLVSWYDVNNVDLLDINCPPYYRARNGQIENIVTSCIINEGMERGWLNGVRIEEMK